MEGFKNVSYIKRKAVPWLKRLVSRRPLTAEVRVLSRVSTCGFLVDRVALAHVSHRVLQFSAVNIIPPWHSILIYLGKEQ
jgi:hypothetical protein